MIALVMGIVAVAVGVYVISGFLSANDWNPTALIKFSPEDAEAFAYAEDLLGDVVEAPGLGHDGKFYFSQAMDPFYLNPEEHAIYLDRPTYRAQRMLYPTLASVFGLAGPETIAWTLIVLNVIALGVGTWLTSLLAMEIGLSPIFGAAFLFNPGVLVSSLIDTAEVFAMLFFILGALLVFKGRIGWAAAALTASVLSRETMVITVLGLGAYLLVRKRRVEWRLAIPVVAAGLWWFYLRIRLGSITDSVQDTQAVGSPFEGFFKALSGWTTAPVDVADLMMGIVLMSVAILMVWRTYRSPNVIGAMVVGFSPIAILMVEPVWQNYFDSSRALAPLITGYLLLVPSSVREPSRLQE